MRAPGHEGVADSRPRRPSGPAVRLAGAVLLLILAALGCAARGVTHLSTAGTLSANSGSPPFIAGVIAVAVACLILAGLLALVAGRRRRRPRDEFAPAAEPVGPWWVRALVLLACLVLVALPVAAVVATLRPRHGQRAGPPVVPVVPLLPGATRPPGPADSDFLHGAAAALAVLVVGALVAAGLWLRRRRAGAARGGPPTAPSPLAAAVAAGTAALGATADARAAIIACYAAMEATLAAAGSPRRAADTPEELLNRAETDGIIRTPAARRLTALFREARFSPHQLADTERRAALAALDEIGRDVAGHDAGRDLVGRP